MANHPRFSEISDAIRAGLDNLGKWYRKTDDTDAYFICLGRFSRWSRMIFGNTPAVLDPNVKLAYAEDKWDAEQLEDAINRLETVVRLFPVPIFQSLFLPKLQFDLYYKPPVALALDDNSGPGMFSM